MTKLNDAIDYITNRMHTPHTITQLTVACDMSVTHTFNALQRAQVTSVRLRSAWCNNNNNPYRVYFPPQWDDDQCLQWLQINHPNQHSALTTAIFAPHTT